MTCPQVFLECVSFSSTMWLCRHATRRTEKTNQGQWFFFFFFLRSFSHHPLPAGWQPRSLPRTCLTFPSHPTQRNPPRDADGTPEDPASMRDHPKHAQCARRPELPPQLRPTRRFWRSRQRREVRRLEPGRPWPQKQRRKSCWGDDVVEGGGRGGWVPGDSPARKPDPGRAGWITTRRGLAATRWWVSVPSPGLLRRPEPRDCPPPPRTPGPFWLFPVGHVG